MVEDWISDLPNHVLEHIVSFLTLKEAVRTGILSKRWKRMKICFTLSNLNFSNLFFDKTIVLPPTSNFRKKNRRLIYVVDKLLLGRGNKSNHHIEKLYLEIPRTNIGVAWHSLESRLERWMNCVAKPGLTELNLLITLPDDKYYDFPFTAFAAVQSLKRLALMGFQITSLSSGGVVWLSSLQSLSLSNVMLDDDVMQKLLKDNPLLDSLKVDCCRGHKVLEVTQPQLKMLCVNRTKVLGKVKIDAPELEVLELSLPRDLVSFETCLPCLQKMTFKGSYTSSIATLVKFQGLKLPVHVWFTEFLPLCPLLENLTINYCPLQNIHVSTVLQALKTLHLSALDNTVDFILSAPKLEKVYLSVYDFPVVELNASDKLDVEINFDLCSSWYGFDGLWHHHLANFFGHFNHSRVVVLSSKKDVVRIPKDMRKDLCSPMYGTKYLEFTIKRKKKRQMNSRRFSEYVEYMLWLSREQQIS